VTKRLFICLCLLALGAIGSGAQEGGADVPKDLLGTWSGSWEGAGGAGGFELTLEKGKDRTAGRVSVTGEPTYSATIKTLSFEGNKMSAVYDFPPDEQLEVVLAASFDAGAATGTWIARAKKDGSEIASGTWKVKKK
jgi:hypothetical protein